MLVPFSERRFLLVHQPEVRDTVRTFTVNLCPTSLDALGRHLSAACRVFGRRRLLLALVTAQLIVTCELLADPLLRRH